MLGAIREVRMDASEGLVIRCIVIVRRSALNKTKNLFLILDKDIVLREKKYSLLNNYYEVIFPKLDGLVFFSSS